MRKLLLFFAFFAAIAAYSSQLYVANIYNNTINIIDTNTNTIIATMPISNQPQEFAFTPDGEEVYITQNNSNTVSVIDTNTRKII